MNHTTENGMTFSAPRMNLALVASALVILALIIVQAGRAAGGGAARNESSSAARDAAFAASMPMSADSVSRVGDFTMMSFNAGSEDVVLVLDGRGEELFAYSIENQTAVKLLGRDKLSDIFNTAAAIGPGRSK